MLYQWKRNLMPCERGTRVDRAGKRRGRGVAGWLGGQGREAGGGREGERGTQVVSPARSMTGRTSAFSPSYHVSVLVAGQKRSFPESDLCSHCLSHVSQFRSWSQGQQSSGSHAQIPEHTSPWNICSTRPTRLRVRVVGRACSSIVLCYTVDEGSECISDEITQGFIHLKITKLEIAVKKSSLLLTSFG